MYLKVAKLEKHWAILQILYFPVIFIQGHIGGGECYDSLWWQKYQESGSIFSMPFMPFNKTGEGEKVLPDC